MDSWLSPELVSLIRELEQRGAWTALVMVLAALPVAWLVPRMLRGPHAPPGSIWFGSRIVDGVLFPALWLLLVVVARHVCQQMGLPTAVFRLAVPVLTSLLAIRFTVRIMRAAFPQSAVVRAVERSVSWGAWIAMVLWVTGVLPSVLDALDDVKWKLHSGSISLRTVLEGTLSAGAVLMITLWISAAIEHRLLRGAVGQRLSWRKAAANVVRAVLVFVGLLMALSAVGIDLTALSVLGGALGVGLGFGLQKLAANYVSGFVILAEGALRIGDTVRVDGFEGRITDITTRYTVLRALNGRESIIPNEMLITQRVESATLADSRVLLTTVVQVAYGTDVETLMPRVADAATGVPRVLSDPPVAVHLSAMAADGLELSVHFWIADPENGTGSVKSDVNRALLRLLDAEGVEIPFPQRVVRLMREGEGGPMPAVTPPPSSPAPT